MKKHWLLIACLIVLAIFIYSAWKASSAAKKLAGWLAIAAIAGAVALGGIAILGNPATWVLIVLSTLGLGLDSLWQWFSNLFGGGNSGDSLQSPGDFQAANPGLFGGSTTNGN